MSDQQMHGEGEADCMMKQYMRQMMKVKSEENHDGDGEVGAA